ncbi:carabin [Notechis scutatus]|uniref:Carabin n=1 Tax=Notechis scutatus TaxID=8663 RepID=A0A6J1TXG5_9SAUR|nr:carabin [Notechis scutatus]
MSDPSLSADNISQAMTELSDAFDFYLRDDASSLGSDSELNGMAPYRKTDRYGFIGGSSLQNGQDHLPVVLIRRRETKWLEMTAHWEKTMARRYRKIKLLCRKGIPSSLRARCWPLLCGGQAKMERSPGKYQELLEVPGDPQWVETITKDIHRQFPFHEMFLSPEGPGQQGLLQLLKAYTVYRPQEGYCQAQGPVGALLLMHMPPEQAFWCLVQICDHYLPGYYSPQMEALVLDSEIFTALLHRVCPKAFKHLQKHGVGPLMYMPEWFLCLFARTLPFPTVLRVWDAFLSEEVGKFEGCELPLSKGVMPRLPVHDVPISEGDLERECRIQLGKLCQTQPKFQYNPKQRLSGAKAIFDVQQLEDAQYNKTGKEIHTHTFHIPKIKVDPPPSSPKEQKRASEVQGQKKEQKRKKPDTRGKTFHAFEHPKGRRERKLEPEATRTKSSFYLEA